MSGDIFYLSIASKGAMFIQNRGLLDHVLPEEAKWDDGVLSYDEDNQEIDLENISYVESLQILWEKKVI